MTKLEVGSTIVISGESVSIKYMVAIMDNVGYLIVPLEGFFSGMISSTFTFETLDDLHKSLDSKFSSDGRSWTIIE